MIYGWWAEIAFPILSSVSLPLSLCNCPERKKSTQLKFIAYILPPAPLCLILRFNSLFSLNRGLSPQRLTCTHTMSMLNRSWGLILATCLCTRQMCAHTHTHPLRPSISQAVQTHPVTAVGSIVSICAVLRWTLTGLQLFTATCERHTTWRTAI